MSYVQSPMESSSMEDASARYSKLMMSAMLPVDGYNLSYQVAAAMAEEQRKSSTHPSEIQANHCLLNNDFLSRYPIGSSPHTQVTPSTACWTTTSFPGTAGLPPSPCPSNSSQPMSMQGHQYGLATKPIGHIMQQNQQRRIAMRAQDRRHLYASLDFNIPMASASYLQTPSPEAQILEEYHTGQLYQHQQAFTVSPQTPESTVNTMLPDYDPSIVAQNTILTPVTTPNLPDTLMQQDDPKEELPYAKLIQLALLSTSDHAMSLRGIYKWFEENTDKANSGTRGWQNSIRHNLSMNQAFQRREREDGTKKKIAEWGLEPWAVNTPVQSTTRYRKPATRGVIRVLSGSGERIQAVEPTPATTTRKVLPKPKARVRARKSAVASEDQLALPTVEHELPAVTQAATPAVITRQSNYHSHHHPMPNVTSTAGASYQGLAQIAPTQYNPDLIGLYSALPLTLPLSPAYSPQFRHGPIGITKPVKTTSRQRMVAGLSATRHLTRYGDLSSFGGSEEMINEMADKAAENWLSTRPSG